MDENIGKKFNMLTIKKLSHIKGKYDKHYLCVCECGNEKVIAYRSLKAEVTKSCGCLAIKAATKHGFSNHKLYYVYKGIIDRCTNHNHIAYNRYGGRGINVCKEWTEDKSSFFIWAVENGYQEGLSIDRIDNDKGYYPENCRWTTDSEQNINKHYKKGKSGYKNIEIINQKYRVEVKRQKKVRKSKALSLENAIILRDLWLEDYKKDKDKWIEDTIHNKYIKVINLD